MSSELRRRVVVTIALLGAAHALRVLPVPGIDGYLWFGDRETGMLGNLSRPWFWLTIPRDACIGGGGITLYLLGSIVATTGALMRGRAEHFRGPRAEVQATLLAAVAAFALSVRDHLHPVFPRLGLPDAAGPPMVVVALTQTGGTLLTIALARTISSAGIGNGACLVWAMETLHDQAAGLLEAYRRDWPPPLLKEHALAFGLVLAALLVVAVVFLEARWRMSEWSGSVTRLFPVGATWNISGAGIVGISLASALIEYLLLQVAMFSPSGISEPWVALAEPGRAWAATMVLVSFVLSSLYTAWVFDPRVASRMIANSGGALDLDAFRRRIVRVLIPAAVTMSIVVLVFRILAVRLGAVRGVGLDAVSAVVLLPAIAIVLDTARQWRTHVEVSHGVDAARGPERCGSCGARAAATDAFCEACGAAIAEGFPCARHEKAHAVARCLVCGEALCPKCACSSGLRWVCERHAGVQFVEGWAVAAVAETGLEVELRKAQLGLAGIRGIALSNTSSPFAATFGIFAINPMVALVPHRECGGGALRLLVAPSDWELATAQIVATAHGQAGRSRVAASAPNQAGVRHSVKP